MTSIAFLVYAPWDDMKKQNKSDARQIWTEYGGCREKVFLVGENRLPGQDQGGN